MRVLVCGGRDFDDAARVRQVLDHYHAQRPFSVVIHGAARGADSLAGQWARAWRIPELPFPADWLDLKTEPVVTRRRQDGTPYNALAGLSRNTRMLREGKPTLVIAFPGDDGTADMVRKSHMAKVPVLEIPRA
jgi:hypothetical protein